MTLENGNLHAKKQGSLLGFFKPQKAEMDVVFVKEMAVIPSAARNEIKTESAAAESRHSVESASKSSSSCVSSSDTSESSESSEMSDSAESSGLSEARRKRKHVKPSKSHSSPAKKKNREFVSAPCEIDPAFTYDPSVLASEPVNRSSFSFHTAVEDEPNFLSSEEIDKLCVGVPPFVVSFIHNYYELCSRFDFPSWFDPKSLRDSQGRVASDPEYNVSTILIPRKNGKVVEEGHSTPMLQQYWSIKEEHFDEIILFKVGKFYELFYMDAALAQPICNLKWMGHDRRAHVGFPEVSLQHHSSLLLQRGYTVCVVEQTETVTEANERSALAGRKSAGALVERKICEMFTSGTLIHEDMIGADAHYLVAISGEALVAVDCASGEFRLFPTLSDSQIRTVLCTLQPKEVLLHNASSEKAHVGTVVIRWKQWEGRGVPQTLMVDDDIRSLVNSSKHLTAAINGIVNYLDHLLLRETVLMCSTWTLCQTSSDNAPIVPLMDSTVLSQLEILKDSEGSSRGSLLKYLDQTCTPFGSRAMKQWVCEPLHGVGDITRRAEVVEYLVQNSSVRKLLTESLKKLPDLERRLQRICSLAMQQTRGAVFFHEAENRKIGVFLNFLDSIGAVLKLFKTVAALSDIPDLLNSLVTSAVTLADTERLRHMVVEKTSGEFVPRPGAFEAYDSCLGEIAAINENLNAVLRGVQSSISSGAIFVHTKYKNEIEIPQAMESKISSDWEITSSRKGFVRFRTDEIKALVNERDLAEEKITDLMYPFMAQLFTALAQDRIRFAALIKRVGDIDCLVALAKISGQPNWVRPEWTPSDALSISLLDSRHPIQEHLMAGTQAFVANDIILKGNTIVVTGANMGGKSTILRQTCISVILAQIGSFVPASRCVLTAPLDRIFTRIGASDNILEGKSTFLTELEETAAILREATSRSLVVIDELGRGTSTFDGVAIAGATLEHLVGKIKCNCLFATHYHKLALEPGISLFHMECLEEQGAVVLTHKFKTGPYPHSQAMHVARIAGLPDSILAEAERVAAKFDSSH